MHDYAVDSRERVFVVRILFMASALVPGIAAALIPSDLLPMQWLLPIPSIALVFGVSYWAFDNWFWRWPFLRVLRLVSVPDLRGTWTGTIASSYTGFKKTQPVPVTIEQTWTKIVVRLNAAESHSWSMTASALTKSPEGLVLTYLFDNDPEAGSVGTMQRFRGTTVLVSAVPDRLEGYYYTGRGRETHGSLKLRRRISDICSSGADMQ